MADTKKFIAKKSLGQHFLTSAVVPGWMVDAALLKPGEVVVEIGPGTGVLTKELLASGARVIAVETDERALEILTTSFASELETKQLQLIDADVRELKLESLGVKTGQYKVVANIPYYLSGLLFRTFLESEFQPCDLVFLVQKEVARRICTELTRGEKESILSLSIKVYGEPAYVRTVTKGHFAPPPKVDSAIIAVRNISKARLGTTKEADFFTLLHLGFGAKRKQLWGNLSKSFSPEQLTNTFSTVGIDRQVRAEDLDIETWLKLTATLMSTD